MTLGSCAGRGESEVKGPAGEGEWEGQSLWKLGLNNLEGLLQAWRQPILKK